MKLLVLGKGGSGKSALVNSLLGFNRGDPGTAKESSEGFSVTTSVGCYVIHKNGVNVKIYDTPGLGNEQRARLILDQVTDVTKGDVDVVLFCIALSRGLRVDDSYYNLISLLTRMYKQGIWRHTIFVLTFANSTPYTEVRLHQQTIENIIKEIRQAMKLAGVDSSIADSVPLLTAGSDRDVLPHETENWKETIFRECRNRRKSSTASLLLQKSHFSHNILTVLYRLHYPMHRMHEGVRVTWFCD